MENGSHYTNATSCFIPFQRTVDPSELPDQFPDPFSTGIHSVSRMAAEELQDYLDKKNDWKPYFGLIKDEKIQGIGKMFGVLVVQNKSLEIGYLVAFSGKIAHTNNHHPFVPPVFDMLEEQQKQHTFYQQGEQELYAITDKIEKLEQSDHLRALKQTLDELTVQYKISLDQLKENSQKNKELRREKRTYLANYPLEEQEKMCAKLNNESICEHFELKTLKKNYRKEHANLQLKIDSLLNEINNLKEKRKKKSINLQKRLFLHYHFLNRYGEIKNVLELFSDGYPPAGAGECCAPKLLHYAFKHELKPIAMAEFWWGISPDSEIRKHRYFYPACKGKCRPILNHMLQGISLYKEKNETIHIHLDIIYEDEWMLAVNKQPEMLSVPGKTEMESVYSLLQKQRKDQQFFMVHRLDMSTSGILLIAKNKQVYVELQKQFAQKTIQKRYVALLDGLIEQKNGTISLPLRVDLDDRPHQLVCFQYGKMAHTHWEVIEQKNDQTRIYFYPITGRTHQLRVHAAHQLGLNTPIIGDNLYGQSADRLYLHAEKITFIHPKTNKKIKLHVKTPF